MKIGVCTLNTPEIWDYAQYTCKNVENYCKCHQYDFITRNNSLDKSRHPAWSKIKLLQKNIQKYDWLMWIDADAIITNYNIKIEDLIDEDYEMIISKEDGDKKYFNTINSGVFLVKNTNWIINFLAFWYDTQNPNCWCWEQAVLNNLYCSTDGIKQKIKIIPRKSMNSVLSTFIEGDFILHFFRNKKINDLYLNMLKNILLFTKIIQ